MPFRIIFQQLVTCIVLMTASMIWAGCKNTRNLDTQNINSPPVDKVVEKNQINYREALKLAIDHVPEWFDLSQCSIEHFEMEEKYLMDATTEEIEFYENNWLFAFKRNIDVIGSVMFVHVDKRTGDIMRIDPR